MEDITVYQKSQMAENVSSTQPDMMQHMTIMRTDIAKEGVYFLNGYTLPYIQIPHINLLAVLAPSSVKTEME